MRVDISFSLHEGEVHHLLEHTLGGLVELAWDIASDAWAPHVDQSQASSSR